LAHHHTIDVHTHIIPENIPPFAEQFGEGEFIRLDHHRKGKAWMMLGDKRFREIDENCWDPAVRIAEMENHAIDQQVICTIPVMFSYHCKPEQTLSIARFLNDDIISTCTRFPEHFIGLGTVPMQDTALAVAELERCMQLGMRGVQIGSNINNENLGEKRFLPFFEACERLGAAVLIHPWNMMGQEHMAKYWLPWLVGMPAEISRAMCSMIFGGVFEKFPSLKVCFAHGGGSFLPTLGRIEHGWECRPDLVAIDNPENPRKYLGRFWVDSHVCDDRMLQFITDMAGEDRVLQGSDYPFPLGEARPGELVRNSQLSDSVKSKVLGTSARSWLGI
jgi:aminocarboxymuconate-semialdehyde decarboxylase